MAKKHYFHLLILNGSPHTHGTLITEPNSRKYVLYSVNPYTGFAVIAFSLQSGDVVLHFYHLQVQFIYCFLQLRLVL